jgi:tRNA nucleotidyltransferase/poly(A) polymerase
VSAPAPLLDRLSAALAAAPPLLRRLGAVPDVWLVGGWLRDACWGAASDDIDIVAPAPLDGLLAELSRLTGAAPFRLNSRFDSYRLVTPEVTLDVMPLHPDGVEADIARRDYTVNTLMLPLAALAVPASGGFPGRLEDGATLRSHPQAWDDLAARTLRMTSAASLADDPLRVLRGYRFIAQWAMRATDDTHAAWRALSGRVLDPAGERVHEELLRWFAGPPVPALRLAAEDGVLWWLFPELQATVGCDQLGYHHLDVWEHTLLALEQLERIRGGLPPELEEFEARLAAAWDSPVGGLASAGQLTRLALLLHDVAKPPTREVRPDGRPSFHGHQEVGPRLMQPVLERLRFSKDEVEYVTLLMREHMRLGYYSEPARMSPKLVYRFIRHLGAATPPMVLHTLADCAATGGALAKGSWERHVRAARLVLQHFYAADAVAAPPLLLDGQAIMQLTGLPPGRLVGQLKAALLEATAAGEVQTAAAAEQFILAELPRLRAAPPPPDDAA